MRDGKPRADGVLIEEQLVVVPAQAGIEGPVAEVDQILDEGGLFEVRTAASKTRRWAR